ncbi:MAG: ABC transporter ATP-binding protein [Candidatus Helarchaeota archaeon]
MQEQIQSVILLKQVNLSRHSNHILKNINLTFMKGRIYCIVGPSGAGKSSLLRLLVRLDSPTSGIIQIEGEDIQKIPPLILRKKIGIVFQIPLMFKGTVFDNIVYGPRIHHKEELEKTAHELLKLVGLNSELLEQDAESLSVGQKQRVAFARTLANKPQILLLDEPTSALDPTSTKIIEGLIMDLVKKRGITIIMVTHQVEQALRLADEIIFMINGEIIEQTSKENFQKSKNELITAFLRGDLKESGA